MPCITNIENRICCRNALNRLPFVVFFLLLWLLTGGALAQSNNNDPCGDGSGIGWPDKGIGVCNLEDTINNIPYNSDSSLQESIDFAIRSCTGFLGFICNTALNFRARVSGPSDNNNYILSDTSGGQLPIGLSFSRSGLSESLVPNNLSSTLFPGATGQSQAASLTISLALGNPANLLPGEYTGLFQFSVLQGTPPPSCFLCLSDELSPIDFTIALTVLPRIRISNLSDMALNANLSGLTEAQQTFCVYSQGSAPFSIRADSGNGNGNFVLAGLDTIVYEAWAENLNTGNPEQLSEGLTSSQNWPGNLYDGCTIGGDNMLLSIRIQQNALADAMDSSYTDTLTLTVELE